MKGQGRQLVLDLPLRQALGRDDFLVTASNSAAVALIDHWPDWPAHAAVIVGPPGSGKSHLVEVWRQRSKALRIQAVDVRVEAAPEILRSGAAAIEDAAPPLDERGLFHLLNLARQQGSSILLTAQMRPEHWKIALPDLLSRLKAIPVRTPDGRIQTGYKIGVTKNRIRRRYPMSCWTSRMYTFSAANSNASPKFRMV